MSQFKQDAFSAVDSFFGTDPGCAADEKDKNSRDISATCTGKRRGLGVNESSQMISVSDRLKEKMLKVGKKRSGESENESVSLFVSDSDEEGRTTAIQDVASESSVAKVPPAHETQTRRKKKGKKERAKNKAQDQDQQDWLRSKDQEDTQASATQPERSLTKRKRRKVRSKQKNIYKDKRTTKPGHLIEGSKNYTGRPMTLATRQKLNLPASKSSCRQPVSKGFLGQIKDAASNDHGDTLSLVIERNDVTSEKIPEPSIKSKQRSKTSSKYRNLR